MRTLLLTIAALAAAAPAAAQTTVFTESFDGVVPQTYSTNAKMGKFTITAGDADVVGDLNGTFFGCGGHNNCVDMNGNYPATITAGVDVIAGDSYRVSMDIAGNGPRPSNLYSLGAGLGNSPFFKFDAAPGDPSRTVSFEWVAAFTGTAQLELQSLNTDTPGYWGMILDNVKVEDLSATASVPEPASWAMLIVGIGAMGTTLRRRRATVSFA